MLGKIFLFRCSFQAKAQITVMEEGCKMENTDGGTYEEQGFGVACVSLHSGIH